MTTVKQLEQELNVSRVSLYAMLKKDWLVDHVIAGDRGTLMVDDAGVGILKDYYARKNRGGTPRKNVIANMSDTDEADAEAGVIGILQEQLAVKDEQINSLLSIMSNQQKLHA